MITEGAIFKAKNKGTSFLWSCFWAEVSSDLKSTVAVSKYRSIQYSGSVSVALLVEIYGSYYSPSNPMPKPNLTLRDSLRHTGRENTLSDRYRYLQILHVAVSVVVLKMKKISLLVPLNHWIICIRTENATRCLLKSLFYLITDRNLKRDSQHFKSPDRNHDIVPRIFWAK